MMFYVYMILNQYNNLYIGITQNPQRRLFEHNTHRGSDYSKTRDVFHIVFLEEHSSLLNARKREVQIKKWRRDKKDFLIYKYQHRLETKI